MFFLFFGRLLHATIQNTLSWRDGVCKNSQKHECSGCSVPPHVIVQALAGLHSLSVFDPLPWYWLDCDCWDKTSWSHITLYFGLIYLSVHIIFFLDAFYCLYGNKNWCTSTLCNQNQTHRFLFLSFPFGQKQHLLLSNYNNTVFFLLTFISKLNG